MLTFPYKYTVVWRNVDNKVLILNYDVNCEMTMLEVLRGGKLKPVTKVFKLPQEWL